MEKHTVFMDWKNQYCENGYCTQSNLQIQYNTCQITNSILHRIRTKIFTICVEMQKISNSQSSLEKDHGIWSHHSWQIDGETGETVTDFILGGSKISADGDCSHEIKRYLLLGRKAMTNLNSILKSRDITLPTKVCLDKAMVFPVVMYGCESWTIKKTDH